MRRACAGWALALAAGLAPAAALAGPYRFVKGPYVQGLTSSEVVVRWEGSEALPGRVVVEGPEGRAEASTEERTPFHGVEVRGLRAATRYAYRVEAGGATSAEGSFTTAPEGDAPFTFVAYGDNRSDPAAHERVVKGILRTPSDFLVHTGDMVHDGGSSTDWQIFFGIEGRLLRDRCLFASVGNHELTGHGAANFLRYFYPARAAEPRGEGGLYYSVRWSNARFFFLNAMATWDSSRDREWLGRELSRSAAEDGNVHRIAVLHHGPFSSGPHGPNVALVRGGVEELLRSRGVDLVLAGHDHIYERGERGGLKYLITGGGGAPLYQKRSMPNPATQAFEASHHFVALRVEGDDVRAEAKRADGTTIETCRYRRGDPWSCEDSPAAVAHQPPSTAPPPEAGAGGRGRSCACSVPGEPGPASPGPAAAALGLVLWGRRRSGARQRAGAYRRSGARRRAGAYRRSGARRRLAAFGAALALAGLGGCSTYARELGRGERAFDDNDYERAEALLRALEPDLEALTPDERVRYCYTRGMSTLRIGEGGPARGEARYWLSLASASLRAHPGALGEGQRARLSASLCQLDREAGCERPAAPEAP